MWTKVLPRRGEIYYICWYRNSVGWEGTRAVSVSEGVFWQRRGGGINIMSSICLCVHLSLFSFFPFSLFPLIPQLSHSCFCAAKWAAADFLLGNYETNKCVSSNRQRFGLHITASGAASFYYFHPKIHFMDHSLVPLRPQISDLQVLRQGNILTGCRQRICLSRRPYLSSPSNIYFQILPYRYDIHPGIVIFFL